MFAELVQVSACKVGPGSMDMSTATLPCNAMVQQELLGMAKGPLPCVFRRELLWSVAVDPPEDYALKKG